MKALRLPIPISVNQAYGNRKRAGSGKGRYRTSSYKAWVKAADVFMLMQVPIRKIHGPYDIKIRLPQIRGDVDNRIKVVLDYLVRCELVDDDRYARKVSIEIDPELGRFDYCEIDIDGVGV